MWVEISERAFLKRLCQEGYAEPGAVAVSHNQDRIHTTLQYSLQSFYM